MQVTCVMFKSVSFKPQIVDFFFDWWMSKVKFTTFYYCGERDLIWFDFLIAAFVFSRHKTYCF